MDLKFEVTGADPVVLTRSGIFLTSLFATNIFKSGAWPVEKLGSQSVLQQCQDWFKQTYEGALTGHKGQIALRKKARQDIVERIQRIVRYLSVMADDSDVAIMVDSKAVILKGKRARKAAKATA
ncbi:MAG TPA: hypothetical protein VJ550_00150 [Geomonas sp.]|nr:hypothetical protein [Geomonas sp.]